MFSRFAPLLFLSVAPVYSMISHQGPPCGFDEWLFGCYTFPTMDLAISHAKKSTRVYPSVLVQKDCALPTAAACSAKYLGLKDTVASCCYINEVGDCDSTPLDPKTLALLIDDESPESYF
ncbi:hypothetical protein H2248_005615 [Termitomyces sp. 'cryptogamus']|nr:hypothetical protein H2248_005615 [Termitomyces sp. 'cryptogamus']